MVLDNLAPKAVVFKQFLLLPPMFVILKRTVQNPRSSLLLFAFKFVSYYHQLNREKRSRYSLSCFYSFLA